jgi:arabinose-5-phosphate isomerase
MNIINEIQKEFNNSINNFDLEQLNKIRNIIKTHKENIFISGIGKCESIAIYFVNLLKSISYKAFHISIQNSFHGDIGCIHNNDLVIVFSKSGDTKELIDFLNITKIKNLKTIGVTCNPYGKINEFTDYQFLIPVYNEISIGITNIPNNSCMMMTVFINIICKMVENIEIYEYKNNHLGGSIGNDLNKNNLLDDSDSINNDLNKNNCLL